MTPFPFIVGCGRSGTTLLRAMLDSHSKMAVPPESHFVVEFALQRPRYESSGRFAAARFVAELAGHERFRTWGIGPTDLAAAVDAPPAADLADAIRRAFALYAGSRGKQRYADKTPSYVLHLPLLAELFPEARFVHLIRDGREVALSMREVEWGPRAPEPAALLWRASVERGRRAGAALGAERYREVRYEDLVAEPARVLRELCDFVELDFEPGMLDYPARADEVIDGFRLRGEHRNLTRPPTLGLRDWRREMATTDQRLFEAVAGKLLGQLGYPTSDSAKTAS